jgi:hypothetical protein
MTPRWLGLSSLDSLQEHMDERKKDFGLRHGLTLHRQTKVIKKVIEAVDHSSWNMVLGRIEQTYDLERKMLRSWLSGREHREALQIDFLRAFCPRIYGLMKAYWPGVALQTWYQSEDPRTASDKVSESSITIGLFSYFLLEQVVQPALRETQGARCLFELAGQFTNLVPWWRTEPKYTQIYSSAPALIARVLPPPPPVMLPSAQGSQWAQSKPGPSSVTQRPNAHPLPKPPNINARAPAATTQPVGSQVPQSQTARPTKPPAPIFPTAATLTQRQPTQAAADDSNSDEVSSLNGTESESGGELEGEEDGVIEVPHWIMDNLGKRRQVQDTQGIIKQFRPRHIPTIDALPNYIHNLVATRIAVRDRLSLAGVHDPTDAEIDASVEKTLRCLTTMDELRSWSLDALCVKVSAIMHAGAASMCHSLGAIVNMHKVSGLLGSIYSYCCIAELSLKGEYQLQVAAAMIECDPTISEDAAINEASRILKGDGFTDATLVDWDTKSGLVSVNILPFLAKAAQSQYGRYSSH